MLALTTEEAAEYLSKLGIPTKAASLEAARRTGLLHGTDGPAFVAIHRRCVRYAPAELDRWAGAVMGVQ